MKMKTLAALVGTLSLSALAAGCASNKASEQTGTSTAAQSAEKPAQGSCGAGSCGGAKTEEGKAQPGTSTEKPAQGSCGAGSCGKH